MISRKVSIYLDNLHGEDVASVFVEVIPQKGECILCDGELFEVTQVVHGVVYSPYELNEVYLVVKPYHE